MRPERVQRDVLLIAFGSLANALMAAVTRLFNGQDGVYDPADLVARVHTIVGDTARPPDLGPDTSFWSTRYIELADASGRRDAGYYLEVLWGRLGEWLRSVFLPRGLTASHRHDRLVGDVQHPEASKNPLRGLIFLLAGLRRVVRVLDDTAVAMTAPNRTIILVFSPLSGTASAAWILLLALLFRRFRNSSPILLTLMPTGLRGHPEHVTRHHGIFGWNMRLLEIVMRHGLGVDWEIPVLGGAPERIRLDRRHPLFLWLASGHRRAGGVSLETTAELVRVTAEMLALAIIGRDNGAELPTLDSHIYNTSNDVQQDDRAAHATAAASGRATDGRERGPAAGGVAPLPVPPGRYATARGFVRLILDPGRAAALVLTGLRVRALRRLLGRPVDGGEPAVLSAVAAPAPANSSPDEADPAAALLADHHRREIRRLYDHWMRVVEERAFRGPRPDLDVIEALDETLVSFREGVREVLVNMREDRVIEARLWKLLRQDLPVTDLYRMPELLEGHQPGNSDLYAAARDRTRPRQGHSASGEGGEAPEDLDALVDALRNRARVNRLALVRLRHSGGGRAEELWSQAALAELRVALIEALREETEDERLDGLLPQMRVAVLGCARALRQILQRAEAALEADEREFEEHESVMRLQRYAGPIEYDLSYPLAQARLDRRGVELDPLLRRWVVALSDRPAERLADADALRRSLDGHIRGIEGLTAFPRHAAGVLRAINDTPGLLRFLLERGRATVEVDSPRYDLRWGVWYSGSASPEVSIELERLERRMREELATEALGVTVNAGALPLRSPGAVAIILSELVCDFTLGETVSDEPMQVYLDADAALAAQKGAVPIHRLYPGMLYAAQPTPFAPAPPAGDGDRPDWGGAPRHWKRRSPDAEPGV